MAASFEVMMTEAELSTIINETKGYVLSAIEKNLPERFAHAIDDVVQETYIRAIKALTKGTFRNESKVSTWIYTIARNESLRMAEKLARHENRSQDLESVEYRLKTDFQEPDYELDILREALGQLPDQYRNVMELVAQGKSEKEVSGLLNIPTGTVKSRASRGREMLRKLIKETTS